LNELNELKGERGRTRTFDPRLKRVAKLNTDNNMAT